MQTSAGSWRVVVPLVLAVALGGCTSPASPGTAVPRPVVPVPSSVQEIPGQPPVVHYGTVDRPEVGVAYEYHLLVHCGIRAAQFGGRGWQAVAPTDGPPAGSPPGTNYLDGSMTLVAADVARFEWSGGSAEFAPAQVVPLCA